MNPDTQLLLKEIQKISLEQATIQQQLSDQKLLLERRFDEVDEAMDQRFKEAESVVEQRIIDSELRQDVRLSAVEKTAEDLTSWRQEQEGLVDDLRLRLGKLDKYWNRSVLETASPFTEPGIFPEPGVFTEPSLKVEQHAAPSSAGYKAARPIGHRDDLHHRGNEFGVVTTLTHSPVTGMDDSFANPPKLHGTASDLILSCNRPPEHQFHPTGKLPKLSFPTFDGTDLQLWITCAEDYFTMYSADPSVWIQCSRMQFLGPAKRWIQSVTEDLKTMSWSQFCQALHTRFDRDQHEFLLRKMNRICQTTSVQDYVDRFAELVDQLKSYDSSMKALPHITRFLDGLFPEIRAVLLVQRPTSLDTAYSLALLQEEAMESSRRRDYKSWNHKGGYQAPPRSNHVPEGRSDRETMHQKPVDKKLADLKAYRRAHGLCDRCGEKWSRDHKCATQVGLHVLDELYALFSTDDAVEAAHTEADTDSGPEEVCCCISAAGAVRTLQFEGVFHNRPVHILLDSGSSSSFVSATLVDSLGLATTSCAPVSVRVANGAIMHCDTSIPDAVWTIHQYHFQHTLKVLPLASYDIVLGMDWLQMFSPMKVDWRQRWLVVPYNGTTVRLHDSSVPPGEEVTQFLIQFCSISVPDSQHSTTQLPAISAILDDFPEVLSPLVSLPLKRTCDHAIPLVEGARPVTVRPYRYPPAIKDEIEAQVDAMLKQGLIQHSTSPFNSPVLMVRKKDGTWRFCVDYRY